MHVWIHMQIICVCVCIYIYTYINMITRITIKWYHSKGAFTYAENACSVIHKLRIQKSAEVLAYKKIHGIDKCSLHILQYAFYKVDVDIICIYTYYFHTVDLTQIGHQLHGIVNKITNVQEHILFSLYKSISK